MGKAAWKTTGPSQSKWQSILVAVLSHKTFCVEASRQRLSSCLSGFVPSTDIVQKQFNRNACGRSIPTIGQRIEDFGDKQTRIGATNMDDGVNDIDEESLKQLRISFVTGNAMKVSCLQQMTSLYYVESLSFIFCYFCPSFFTSRQRRST